MRNNFAALHQVPGIGQVLALVEQSDEGGPQFKITAQGKNGIECSVAFGPWSDDEKGWNHVQKLLADFDKNEAEKVGTMLANNADGMTVGGN